MSRQQFYGIQTNHLCSELSEKCSKSCIQGNSVQTWVQNIFIPGLKMVLSQIHGLVIVHFFYISFLLVLSQLTVKNQKPVVQINQHLEDSDIEDDCGELMDTDEGVTVENEYNNPNQQVSKGLLGVSNQSALHTDKSTVMKDLSKLQDDISQQNISPMGTTNMLFKEIQELEELKTKVVMQVSKSQECINLHSNTSNQSKPSTQDKDFKKAYLQLAQRLQSENHESNFIIPSSDYANIFKNDLYKVNFRYLLIQKPSFDEITERLLNFEEQRKMKLQYLKDQTDRINQQECTFTPNLKRSKSVNKVRPQRSTQQFLQEQYQREQERLLKINMNINDEIQKEKSLMSRQPKINPKSRILAEKKIKYSYEGGDVHNRLYEQNQRRQFLISQKENQPVDENNQIRFKPQISKKSQEIKRGKPVQDHLYEDALKRKFKKEVMQVEHEETEQRNLISQGSKQLSNYTEKYFIQKFTKEVIRIWSQLELDDESQSNETMNQQVLMEFLLQLGFLTQTQNFEQEQEFLEEIWRHLGGETRGHVTLNNMRMFLLAILGTFVEPLIPKNVMALVKLENTQFGRFNEHGDLFLESYEVPKIQKYFHQMQINRVAFEAKNHEIRKRELMTKQELNFQPNINKNSSQIAKKYRQRIEQTCQTKLEAVDWLLQPIRNHEWQEAAQKILENEQLQECTFKPEINQYKPSRQKSQEILAKYKFNPDSSSASKFRFQGSGADSSLLPADKCAELYELSKVKQSNKWRFDKSKEDYEFEKNKDECTFTPNLSKMDVGNKSTISIGQKKSSNSIIQSRGGMRAQESAINRMKSAREERDFVNALKSQGKHRNDRSVSKRRSKSPYKSVSKKDSSTYLQQSMFSMGTEKKLKGKTIAKRSKSRTQQINPAGIPPRAMTQMTQREVLHQEEQQTQVYQSVMHNQLDEYLQIKQEEQQQEQQERLPLLYVDVNLGPETSERIIVYEGSTAEELSKDFAVRHGKIS